ncbi:MAG: hypothetical protein PHT12_03410 [Patescibacteria group bacterium]|nr:hypothetical protein [Patescibacteria group bacterium]
MKSRKTRRQPEETSVLPVPIEELATVRAEENGKKGRRGNNFFIGTLNVFSGLTQPFADPMRKVCYEPFQTHWEERYRKRYPRHGGKLLILDLTLLAVFGALLVGGLFSYFVLPIFPQPQIVSLTVLSPQKVVSGQPTDFIISYRNETGSPLASAELKVNLPEGFVPDEPAGAQEENAAANTAAPTNVQGEETTSQTFPIGDLKPFGQGEIRLKGTIFLPIGLKTTLAAEFIYWREGESSPTRQAVYNEWLIEDSLLDVGLRTEDEILRGRQNSFAVTYVNNGDTPIDAVIRLTTPDDFVLTGAQPTMTGANEWRLRGIEPGARGSIDVYGILRANGARGAEPNFTVRGYLLRDGSRYLTQETRQSVATLTTGFEIGQEVAEPAGSTSLKPGQEVAVTVRYRNGGDQPIENLKITVQPTERYVAMTPDEQLAWDKETTPELRKVAPGTEGEITAHFRVRPDINPELIGADPFPLMEIKTYAEYSTPEQPTKPVHAEAAALTLPITTDLQAHAAAFYYTQDGDQVGVGPLPPRVGQTTKYRIVLQALNSTNAVHDARLEAVLPPGVEWTGVFSVTQGEPLVRLPVENRIQWEIGEVAAGATGPAAPTASFEVSLTPTPNEVGTVPTLLKDIVISGLDAVTDVKVRGMAPAVTADLPLDEKASGTGTVMPASVKTP